MLILLFSFFRETHTVLKHWKTSVKANHFVMALHDHFTQRRYSMSGAQKLSSPGPPNLSDEKPVPAKEENETNATNSDLPPFDVKDQWTLRYISAHLVRPLIEVLDEDMSSFVTIDEVNAFTAACPAEWRYVVKLIS